MFFAVLFRVYGDFLKLKTEGAAKNKPDHKVTKLNQNSTFSSINLIWL